MAWAHEGANAFKPQRSQNWDAHDGCNGAPSCVVLALAVGFLGRHYAAPALLWCCAWLWFLPARPKIRHCQAGVGLAKPPVQRIGVAARARIGVSSHGGRQLPLLWTDTCRYYRYALLLGPLAEIARPCMSLGRPVWSAICGVSRRSPSLA